MSHARSITLVCAAVAALAAPAFPRAAQPSRAPNLTLADLKGARVKIDYRAGKLTLVNFWAVWCGPCREEMPQIGRLVERYGKQGFQAIGIAVESGAPADVREFLDQHKDYGINYPILMGDDDTLLKFGDVQAVPTTFLIDPDGRVIKRFIGVTPAFSAKVEAEIKKAVAPPPGTRRP